MHTLSKICKTLAGKTGPVLRPPPEADENTDNYVYTTDEIPCCTKVVHGPGIDLDAERCNCTDLVCKNPHHQRQTPRSKPPLQPSFESWERAFPGATSVPRFSKYLGDDAAGQMGHNYFHVVPFLQTKKGTFSGVHLQLMDKSDCKLAQQCDECGLDEKEQG